MTETPVLVESIGPEDTGIYRVTTQGSVHTWDLNAGTYVREPRRHNPYMTHFHNGVPQKWMRVDRWPEVGATFLTILSGDIPWHRSSTIKTIEKVA